MEYEEGDRKHYLAVYERDWPRLHSQSEVTLGMEARNPDTKSPLLIWSLALVRRVGGWSWRGVIPFPKWLVCRAHRIFFHPPTLFESFVLVRQNRCVLDSEPCARYTGLTNPLFDSGVSMLSLRLELAPRRGLFVLSTGDGLV